MTKKTAHLHKGRLEFDETTALHKIGNLCSWLQGSNVELQREKTKKALTFSRKLMAKI